MNLDTPKRFPKPLYKYLSNETCYTCNGSSCSCKFLKDRSNFDILQFTHFKDNTPYNLPVLKQNINNSKGWL